MNANEREYLDALMERVVGAVYEVANVLGAGFLEKVYERALVRDWACAVLTQNSRFHFRFLTKVSA